MYRQFQAKGLAMAKCLNIAAEIFVLSVVCWCVFSAPIKRKDLTKAATFFLRFGYLNKSDPNDFAGASKPDAPSFVTAVKNLQRFGDLPVTGELNRETIQLINTRRCGRDDPVKKLNNTKDPFGLPKIGEYYLQGTYWRKKHLTYRFLSLTRDLGQDAQKDILRRMISKWEEASQLTIVEADSSLSDDKVDILIRFVTGYHGDPYPFDGEGGTLAHAYYPHENKGLAGDAHFDDSERFTTGTKNGINLDWVAVHEFGHSLGLEHSNVRESIMYPWYKGYFPNIELTYDDIAGIQALYGKPTATPSPTPKVTDPPTTTASTTPKTTHPTITASHPGCQPDVEYDAVVTEQNFGTHFFKGHRFWTLSNSLRSKTAPNRVRDCWAEVETPVDAAYLNKDGHVVFFKGSKFWEYYSQGSCPKRLHSQGNITDYNLPLDLENMDMVFMWKRNKKTYFFKDGNYWRLDEYRSSLSRGYPKSIRVGWPDLPNKLNAAVTWRNDRSYVFSQGWYYRLQNESNNRKVYADPGYPRDIRKVWMRCQLESVGALVASLGATP